MATQAPLADRQCNRRRFLKLAGAGVAAWAFSGARAQEHRGSADESQRCNVIFILRDDHRYDFMSFTEGSPDSLEPPNLDRMVHPG